MKKLSFALCLFLILYSKTLADGFIVPVPRHPDEPLPPIGTLGFRVQRYGMLQWGDLFTARQNLTLITLAKHIRGVSEDTIRELLALSLSKFSERNNTICDPWTNRLL